MSIGEVPSRKNFLCPCHRDLGINKERVNEAIASALDTLKKAGITLTAPLPFSARSIPLNLIRTPIRLLQCIKAAATPAIKEKSLKIFKEIAITKFKAYVKIDWNGGIKDTYKDLSEKPSHKDREKRLKILKEAQTYAKLQYCNQEDRYEKNKVAYLSTSRMSLFSNPVSACFSQFKNKIVELGLEEDERGGFYNKNTGILFNLAYNKETNEFAICFHGLTNELCLQGNTITPSLKKGIGLKNKLYALLEGLGSITPIGLEAIKLGELLKETASKNNLNAVVIGHSHGGGLAQCAALANDLKGVVFNSRPVGAGMRRYIGQDKIALNAHKITAFSGRGDYLTQNAALNFLGIVTERFLGIIVPRTVGKGYVLPQLSKKFNNHNDFDRQLERAIELHS